MQLLMGAMMRRLCGAGPLMAILMLLAACADVRSDAGQPLDTAGVPKAYQGLYQELARQLNHLDKQVTQNWDGQEKDVQFGVELLVANSNRGEILLTERVFKGTVITLDRLQDLGVKSIAVSIQFPLLTRSFPRAEEYMAFYRRVAQEIRRRDFVFVVEIGAFFKEAEFTKLEIDYDQMTMDSFTVRLREMTEVVIRQIEPDYLTILTEPDTMTTNTGLDFSVTNFSNAVRGAIQGLEPGKVKLGTGAGSWSPMAYFRAMADIPGLHYLDIHIYPVQRGYVWDKVLRIADMAGRQGKRVSIGEAWLYKVSNNEIGAITPLEAFTRDVYAFWQPLDSRFITVVAKVCHLVDAQFCSFFWMKHLYAYMAYDSHTAALSPQQVITQMDRIAGKNIYDNRLSKTGETFKAVTHAR
jgi:hypothetical protein